MKIYLSSSWKQRVRVRDFAIRLRGIGHDVYDFTDPACRKTPEIPPERFPDEFDPERQLYVDYIQHVPEWRQAVMCNKEALEACDLVILMLPCGSDAHADWALAVGMGKPSIVCGQPRKGERTPSHLWADRIMRDENEVFASLLGIGRSPIVRAPVTSALTQILAIADIPEEVSLDSPAAGERGDAVMDISLTRTLNPAERVKLLVDKLTRLKESALRCVSRGVALIAEERQRQISDEGYTPEHDDRHDREELARAAAAYAVPTQPWPWHSDGDRRSRHAGDRLRQLAIAGALIAAEIDRLLRLKADGAA